MAICSFGIVIRNGSVDKVAVFQIEKHNSMVQIQLVPINIFSQDFFIYICTVYYKATTFLVRISLHVFIIEISLFQTIFKNLYLVG